MSQVLPVEPPCPQNCATELPSVDFSKCAPILHTGQIQYVYITNVGNSLTDWTSAVEWASRLSNSSSAADAIRTLYVIGSKPKPESNTTIISLGRRVTSKKTHTIPVKVDETNAVNYEFVRQNECNGGGQYLGWFETSDGQLHGGNSGIIWSMTLDYIIPEDDKAYCTFEGVITWDSLFTPQRIDSPISH